MVLAINGDWWLLHLLVRKASAELRLGLAIAENPEQRHGCAHYGVENEKRVGLAAVVNHHVCPDLFPVEPITQDFDHGNQLERQDVKHENVERVVATINEETLDVTLVAVDDGRNVVEHEKAYCACERQCEHIVGLGAKRHAMKVKCRTGCKQQKANDGENGIFGNGLLVLAIEHANAKEEHSPALSDAALHHGGYAELKLYFDKSHNQCQGADAEACDGGAKPCAAITQEQKQGEKHNAAHEQSPEKPERSGKKLIVAAHGENDVEQALHERVEIVGVGNAAFPVAIVLIEYAHGKERIVGNKKKQSPLDKWQIKPLEPLDAEIPRIVNVFAAEEIACRDEEHRHVKEVDEIDDARWPFGVTHAHEDYCQSLANGDTCVALACHVVRSQKMG